MSVPSSYIEQIHKRLRYSDLSITTRVEEALRNVPRHYFVDANKTEAYRDTPLPIPGGQTISAPHMYAMMLSEELTAPREGMDVLEIGTGSGYGAALLAYVVKPGVVYTVERQKKLVEFARSNMEKFENLENIKIIHDDGTSPSIDHQFDRILVTAAGPKIPKSLIDKLKPDGRMVIPIEDRGDQWLSVVTKKDGQINVNRKFRVRFVPLIGQEGFEK